MVILSVVLPISLLLIVSIVAFLIYRKSRLCLKTKPEQENQQPTDAIELGLTRVGNHLSRETIRSVSEEFDLYNQINDELYDTISESDLASTIGDKQEYSEQQPNFSDDDMDSTLSSLIRP